ncbi:CsbD family protein [Streptomyces sp. LN245]|uniref:CsbD family protein n=1 Tax=Streptomyces sp. LN245 TaxID=3112975 RepID=UPI00371F5158
MSVVAADEKAQVKGEQVEGKVKKIVGGAVGNESLKAKGQAEESKGDLRAAKEKARSVLSRPSGGESESQIPRRGAGHW